MPKRSTLGHNNPHSQVLGLVLTLLSLLTTPADFKNIEPKKGLETSPLTEVEVVEGGRAVLPCDVSPPISSDDTILVLFYRGDYGTPIFSIDGRDGPVRDGDQWADETALGSRSFLEVTGREPGLVIQPVRDSDQDQYRCRVDYRSHPTRNVRVHLNVVVPPRRVVVLSEAGVEVSGVIGPYTLGSPLSLQCQVHNGRPPPRVTWWTKTTLLDDLSEEQRGQVTINTLTLRTLSRDDLYRVLTCQAENSKLSTPTATSLTVDMIFPPVQVEIVTPGNPLEEGGQYRVLCQTSGSRPKADVTWWKDGMLMTDAETQVFHEGNVTRSTLKLSPTLGDHDTYISCRAQNPLLKAQVIEDALKLDVHYKPRLSLAAGQSLDMEDIKEGDDVYFECGIKANPKVYKVQWFHDGIELSHNISGGVIQSNQSLVLQRVSRGSTGGYTCSAANTQGDATSGEVTLSVKFAPSCLAGQKVVYGAGKHEQINVTCSVQAHPQPTDFRWAFNSSSEVVELPRGESVRVEEGVSQVRYTPRSHLDYGSLLCWAKNSVDTQTRPCIFHVIHAAPPDPVNNCTVDNLTTTGAEVRCMAGWDGGLAQTFTLTVSHNSRTASSKAPKKAPRVLANTSTFPRPEFSLAGLTAATGYILTITGVNKKGMSDPVRMAIVTLKDDMAVKRTSPVLRMVAAVSPLMGVVAGVVVSVTLLCLVVVGAVWVKVRKRRRGQGQRINKVTKKEEGVAGSEGDEKNPDLIPVSHDQQVKEAAKTGSPRQTTSSLQLHNLQQHSDLQRQDLQHSDLQRRDQPIKEPQHIEDPQHIDLAVDVPQHIHAAPNNPQHIHAAPNNQQHIHAAPNNPQRNNLTAATDPQNSNLATNDPQHSTAKEPPHISVNDPTTVPPKLDLKLNPISPGSQVLATSPGTFYPSHQPLKQQRSLGCDREADPLLLLGRSLVTASATSPQPGHLRSASLGPHALMSSTPTSPYDGTFHAPFPYPGDVPLTSTLPRHHHPLHPLAYKRQYSISNIPRSITSPESYANRSSPYYAHHRHSLGKNDFLFLDQVRASLAGRRSSASAIAIDCERPEVPLGSISTRHSVFEDIIRQRESEV